MQVTTFPKYSEYVGDNGTLERNTIEQEGALLAASKEVSNLMFLCSVSIFSTLISGFKRTNFGRKIPSPSSLSYYNSPNNANKEKRPSARQVLLYLGQVNELYFASNFMEVQF